MRGKTTTITHAEQKGEKLAPHVAALRSAVDEFERGFERRVAAARKAAALLG